MNRNFPLLRDTNATGVGYIKFRVWLRSLAGFDPATGFVDVYATDDVHAASEAKQRLHAADYSDRPPTSWIVEDVRRLPKDMPSHYHRHVENHRNRPVILAPGQRFQRLEVLEKFGQNEYREFMWLCACDCGELTVVRSTYLRRGVTKSCGCLKVDQARSLMKAMHTEGRTYAYTRMIPKSTPADPLQYFFRRLQLAPQT